MSYDQCNPSTDRDVCDFRESPLTAASSPPNEKKTCEPCLNGYQLIGDSQFLRFSEQLLHKDRIIKRGKSFLGLCVSGQKIRELLMRVRDNFNSGCLSDKVVVMIGTNDLVRNTSLKDMCKYLDALVEQLLDKAERQIILLTIPPVPRLADDRSHWYRLSKYNEHILRYRDEKRVMVINAYAKFVERKQQQSVAALTSSQIFDTGSESDDNDKSSLSNVPYDKSLLLSSSSSSPVRPLSSGDSPDNSYINSNSEPDKPTANGCDNKSSGGLKRSNPDGDNDESAEKFLSKKQRTSSSDLPTMDAYQDEKLTSFSSSCDDSLPMSDSNSVFNLSTFNDRNSTSTLDEDIKRDACAGNTQPEYMEVLKNGDCVLEQYFEQYFDYNQNRKDGIHLNNDGLRILHRLFLDAMCDHSNKCNDLNVNDNDD